MPPPPHAATIPDSLAALRQYRCRSYCSRRTPPFRHVGRKRALSGLCLLNSPRDIEARSDERNWQPRHEPFLAASPEPPQMRMKQRVDVYSCYCSVTLGLAGPPSPRRNISTRACASLSPLCRSEPGSSGWPVPTYRGRERHRAFAHSSYASVFRSTRQPSGGRRAVGCASVRTLPVSSYHRSTTDSPLTVACTERSTSTTKRAYSGLTPCSFRSSRTVIKQFCTRHEVLVDEETEALRVLPCRLPSSP